LLKNQVLSWLERLSVWFNSTATANQLYRPVSKEVPLKKTQGQLFTFAPIFQMISFS
jgi:hypothetical protein